MAVALPNGATISIASTYAASKTMNAVSNAATAVATLEGSHGVLEGDVIVITSGWSRLNDRVVVAGTVASNSVDLDGINSTDTTKYPAGTGTGSVKEVTAWTQITQVLEATTAGGEQQFTQYSFLEDATERQIPTTKSARSFTLSLGDDTSLSWYAVLDAADEDRLPRAIKLELPSGDEIYYNCYVTLNKTPSLTKNQVMALQCTLSLVADPTRYSA